MEDLPKLTKPRGGSSKKTCVRDRRLPSHRGALLGELRPQDSQRTYPEEATQEDGRQPKKRTVGAMERDEWQRAAWRVTVAEEIDARRLVFVDEMGTNTSLSPLYGVAASLQPDFGGRVPRVALRTLRRPAWSNCRRIGRGLRGRANPVPSLSSLWQNRNVRLGPCELIVLRRRL